MPDIMWDAPASPDEVTFAIRQIPLRSELVLSSLANITYSESHTVRWGEVTRRNRLAKYRAFDGPVAKSARDDAADRAIRLAPFSNSLDLGEYERLVIEFERMAGGNRRVLADALYDDAENLTTSMHNRVEKALAHALHRRVRRQRERLPRHRRLRHGRGEQVHGCRAVDDLGDREGR